MFDGDVLPGDQYELYQAKRFNDTPILVGTNSDEGGLFARPGMTPALFEKQIRDGYGKQADAILAAYPHATDAEAAKAGKDIFRESAFAWHTWAWAMLQTQKGQGQGVRVLLRSPDAAVAERRRPRLGDRLRVQEARRPR